ncbi:3-phosphoinositide-dependent protein kinase 1 [Nymphon striatum]|nr:3-phosphoinositide-dependent protein kinase 1 [Nymphon striatum]
MRSHKLKFQALWRLLFPKFTQYCEQHDPALRDKIEEFSNDNSETPTRKNSFVGTAEYVSPELLTNKCVHESSDLWALGCIIYQMLSGSPPFQAANEYLIFQKILKLDYVFTDEFSSVAKDLVKNLLVNDPKQRLGSSDTDGYPTIKSHKFFSGINWTELYKQQPPHMLPHAAEASSREKLKSGYQIPSHLEPGLDDKQMTRLLGLDLHDDDDEPKAKTEEAPKPVRTRKTSVLEYSPSEISRKVEEQAQNNVWHRFVQGNLILKQGLVDKRKGLFARRRMLLLTTGPRLFYVDPVNMVLKGEIPWSHDLKPEPKNFKTFFVHTPNRTYYLEDPEGYALEWCRVIDEVRKSTYNIT